MNKKINRRRLIDDTTDEPQESVKLLNNIHHKLHNSAALNGGFDKLIYMIDGIEKSQIQIVEKVDKIHEAIYHPDDGLFARIASNKSLQIESTSLVEKQIDNLTSWRDQIEVDNEKKEEENEELKLKFQRLETSIETIKNFQLLTISIAKWAIVAFGGGLITLVFKILYEKLKNIP